jgi:type II secretory pathway pseudopilin PulG
VRFSRKRSKEEFVIFISGNWYYILRIILDMKRPFTLIEILIGFALASLILGMLFTSLHETSLASSRLEKAEKEILGRAEFQQRLDAIFGNLIYPNEGTPLYLIQKKNENGKLCFQFRPGIDPDPCFSDQVTGVLELKNEGLSLRVTGDQLSEEDSPKEREEIIKRGVTKVTYEFLSGGEVFNIWEEKETAPPDYLKLILFYGENKKEEYVFWIKKEPIGMLIK